MNRLVGLAGIALITVAVFGQNPSPMNGPIGSHGHDVVLPDLEAGEHYLKVVVAADGSATYNPLVLAKPVGPTPPEPTPTPTPPPSPVLTDRAKEIKARADAATGDPTRADTAVGLATVYRGIAKLIRDNPTISEANANQALVTGTNLYLLAQSKVAGQDVSPHWKPMRDKLGTYWTEVKFNNKPIGDYASLLDEAADGLQASAGPQKRISPEMLQIILEILKLLLAFFGK